MKKRATPLGEMLAKFDKTNGNSTRSYWPQQKMFFELFRRELQTSKTWMEAAKKAYSRAYNNHRFYAFIRWPKIWERIRDIVLEEFENVGLTRLHVASGLKESFDEGNPSDRARIARLFYEIEGEVGPRRNEKRLPDGEVIDFTEIMQQALKGMPSGQTTLVPHVSSGGVSGSESTISSGDSGSPLRYEEETESDHCTKGILQDHAEVS